MSRPRTLIGVAAVLAALLAPSAAEAARTKVSTDAPASGPQLAGGEAIYLVRSGNAQEIRAAGPGAGPSRTLRSFPVPRNADDCCFTSVGVGFNASATRLATLFTRADSVKGTDAGAEARLQAGPLVGPDTEVYSCRTERLGSVRPFDVDGDRIAFAAGPCAGKANSVVVRDLATGTDLATVSAPADSEVVNVRLAGRYLAYAHAGTPTAANAPYEVVVRDLSAGTDVIKGSIAGSLDLQDDGKLVAAGPPGPAGCPSGLSWYSPAEPTRHALNVCAASSPQVAGDRILVRRETPGGGGAGDLALVDLTGNARVLASAGEIDLISPDYDFDGTRATYRLAACLPAESGIYLDDLAPADPVALPAECPATPKGGRLRAGRTGLVTVSVACPQGCQGVLGLVRGRRTQLTQPRDFAGGPGTVRVRLRLSRPARALLARRRSLKAVIEGGYGGPSKASAGRTFRRSVTLLAPRARR